ncbi:MAG: hypothetical protein ABIH50_04060 [bacterium]
MKFPYKAIDNVVMNTHSARSIVLVGNRTILNCPPGSRTANLRHREEVAPLKGLSAKMILTTRDDKSLNDVYLNHLKNELNLGDHFSGTVLSVEDLTPENSCCRHYKSFGNPSVQEALNQEGIFPPDLPRRVITIEGAYTPVERSELTAESDLHLYSWGEVPIPLADGQLPLITIFLPGVLNKQPFSQATQEMFSQTTRVINMLFKSPNLLDLSPANRASMVKIEDSYWYYQPNPDLTAKLSGGSLKSDCYHRFLIHPALVAVAPLLITSPS